MSIIFIRDPIVTSLIRTRSASPRQRQRMPTNHLFINILSKCIQTVCQYEQKTGKQKTDQERERDREGRPEEKKQMSTHCHPNSNEATAAP